MKHQILIQSILDSQSSAFPLILTKSPLTESELRQGLSEYPNQPGGSAGSLAAFRPDCVQTAANFFYRLAAPYLPASGSNSQVEAPRILSNAERAQLLSILLESGQYPILQREFSSRLGPDTEQPGRTRELSPQRPLAELLRFLDLARIEQREEQFIARTIDEHGNPQSERSEELLALLLSYSELLESEGPDRLRAALRSAPAGTGQTKQQNPRKSTRAHSPLSIRRFLFDRGRNLLANLGRIEAGNYRCTALGGIPGSGKPANLGTILSFYCLAPEGKQGRIGFSRDSSGKQQQTPAGKNSH